MISRHFLASVVAALVSGSSIGTQNAMAQGDASPLDASLVRDSGWQSPEQEATGFKLPPGFTVRLFASEPMIHKPINMAFDDKGRLWVSSSKEYPFPAKKDRWEDAQGSRVRDSEDAIKILEDTDGDGVADKVTNFADGLNVPIAVLPYKNGCIAWSIPNLWYFADNDGDGKCDERKILFGPLGYEKDTHGNIASLRLAPDGWVYATHGFSNTSRFQVRPENRDKALPPPALLPKPTPRYANANLPREQLDWGNSLELSSGNVFRFRPDGSAVEIWTWGQVNPFGLTWDSWGNLYSADCHSNPTSQLIRSAAYPSFGRPHLGLGFAPVLCGHSHDSTGICGPLYLDGGIWGAEWDDHMLLCNPVTSRINRDVIRYAGATPEAVKQPDFMTSTDLWFRPVDIQLGPEGALYIADFYNKIIGHYEVDLKHPGRDRTSGRIWRVVKEGVSANKRTPAPGQQRSWQARFTQEADLSGIEDLPPPARRLRVEATLNHPPAPEILPALHSLWLKTPTDDASLRHTILVAARHALTSPGAWDAMPAGIHHWDALDAISRSIPTPGSARWLLGHLKKNAAISPADLAPSITSLARNLPAEDVPRLITLAKERFPGDDALQADLVQAVGNGLAERGAAPGGDLLRWAREIAEKRLAFLGADGVPDWQVLPHTPRKGQPPSESPWGLQERPCADGQRRLMLSSLPQPGGEWEQRTGILGSREFTAPAGLSFWLCGHEGHPAQPAGEKNFVRLVDAASGDEILRAHPPRDDTARHVTWDLDRHSGNKVRLEIVDGESGNAWAWLAVGGFSPEILRLDTFRAHERAKAQLQVLAPMLRHFAPAELREKLAAYLPPPPPAPPSIVTPEQRAKLDDMIQQRLASFATAKPDTGKGGRIFSTNCAACHAIGGKGALVGPQLDGAGQRGAQRLLEDIIDPNRHIDSNFYLHLITKKDGSVFAGLERGSVGEILLGIDAAGKEHRIAKSDIASNEITGMSLMPGAFGESLPESDLHDLLGWLMLQKTSP